MNIPFGLPVIKDTIVKKKDESPESAALYEQKLAEYREALENYKKCILEYSDKLDSFDKRTLDNQLSIVQTAIDLTYLKEQGDRSFELLEELKDGPVKQTLSNLEGLVKAVIDTNDKIEGLDKNVVNRLSELTLELHKQTLSQNKQLQTELYDGIDQLNRNIRKSHTLLWFLIIFNVLGLSGIIFIVLYVMEIIPF